MPPHKAKRQTHAELKELQRITATAIMRPLTRADGMLPDWVDGRPTVDVVDGFIKPNDRLTSFERLEIYNRQYWFRLIDIMYEDHPGLRAVVGPRKFDFLIRGYLHKFPSRSYSLRDLGENLVRFLEEEPQWSKPRQAMALDMARFEWAQTLAFDEAALPAITADDLLGRDPSSLRLKLQPYVSLLGMKYPLDEYSIVVRRNELRSQASNAADTDRSEEQEEIPPLPRRENVHVVVHRHQNALYYKRLEIEAYKLLIALRDGSTLEEAVTTALPANAGAEWGVKLKTWFETWTALGWFSKA